MLNVSGDEFVISGISGRFPESDNLYEFWEALMTGVDLTTSDDRRWPVGFMGLPPRCGNVKNADSFDARFFATDDPSADSTDPQLRMFFEVVYETIVDAGIIPNDLRGSNTAIVMGLCYIDTSMLTINDLAQKNSLVPMYTKKTVAIVSQCFGFTGPAFEVDSACASCFSALFEGIQLMKAGQCDKLIVGGAALHLSPEKAMLYKDLKITSLEGKSKCLDASGDGFCRSEAVAAFLVEKKKDAKRIYATIKDIQTNNDGFTPEGLTYPNVDPQRKLMQSVIDNTEIDPLTVNYIESHITGTSAGDPIESQSILDAYRNGSEKPIMFGCLKSNIGHTEEVSAIAALTKVALIFQKHIIPPNRNYITPNPNIAALCSGQIVPVLKKTHFDGEIIPINSFGLGGSNVHAIFEANKKVVNQDSVKIVEHFPRLVNISGRTEEGLEYAMDWIEANRKEVTKEFLALLNDISKTPVETGMHCRAFMIFGENNVLKKRVCSNKTRRPIWLIFPGLDSQSKEMLKEVASFPILAKSIQKCAQVLSSVGVNLFDIITNESTDAEIDIITAFVSIVSIQVALVDLLFFLGIKPDGIIGHSMGEFAAAYADGCLTLKEAVLTAFYTAKISSEIQKEKAATAAVGLSWEEGLSKCPSGVYPDCDNSVDAITISGTKDCVSNFVEQLKQEKIFAKTITSCEMAYHTPLVTSIAAHLSQILKKVIKMPKFKSHKMISTSTDYQHVQCDAAYFASMVSSPVMFRKAASKIPQNACIVQVGPSAILLPILNKCFADSFTVSLLKKDCLNNVENIISAIGLIYCSGNNVNIEKLYPKVEYPVPRETLSLSHLLKWDHSKSYYVANYAHMFNNIKAKARKKIDLMSEEWSFIRGHCIDGRILFPATGYLYVVWCQYAVLMTENTNLTFPIEFRDVSFGNVRILRKSGSCVFDIAINEATGRFTVVENGSLRATGYIGVAERTSNYLQEYSAKETNCLTLKKEQIYKEFRIRGYDYGKTFRLCEEATADGSYSKVKWTGNWVSFVDCALQVSILAETERLLMLPTSIEYMLCNTDIFTHAIGTNVDVVFDKKVNQTYTHGICVKGFKGTSIPRRTDNQIAKLTYQTFAPYYLTLTTKEERLRLVNDYFEKCITLLDKLASQEWYVTLDQETCSFNDESNDFYSFYKRLIFALKEGQSLKKFFETLTEVDKKTVIFQTNCENILVVQLKQIMENTTKKLFIVEFNDTESKLEDIVVNETYFMKHEYHASPIDAINNDISMIDANLVIYKDVSTELIFDDKMLMHNKKFSKLLTSLENLLTKDGFLLITFRNKLTSLERKLFSLRRLPQPQLLTEDYIINTIPKCFTLIGKRSDDLGVVSCIFKKMPNSRIPIFIKPQYDCYDWVEKIKSILKEKKEKVIWLLAKPSDLHGVVGLTRCLKKEPEGERFRCFISEEESVPEFVLRNDLIMNIFENQCYGVFIHKKCEDSKKDVQHSHLDIKTKGDLSSLRWYESSHNKVSQFGKQENDVNLINVYYGALNFKDVLIAAGKIPTKAYPQNLHQDGNLGFEYSGIDEHGNKIMGIAKINTIATTIVGSKNDFCWPVPRNWSLKEAASVPVVYFTAYYALLMRAKLKEKETILIHAGSGGVGQAAITLCLSMKCEVFTSVGTKEKKQFLMDKFPQLQEKHFVNSRDVTFEEHILKETNGKGVDVILNSLAEEKLRATINCLAEFGRFIEIGKVDMVENNTFDSSLFERNQSFHCICIAHLQAEHFAGNTSQSKTLYDHIKNGLTNGHIKPIQTTTFDVNEVEKAFRYIASGKHIGKVLIKIRDESTEMIPKPKMISSIRRTYCDPSKVYILFGGLGGLGLEVAFWLCKKGAKKFVITSRQGIRDEFQQNIINMIKCNAGTVDVVVNDASTYEKTQNIFDQALNMGQIGGIFNLSLILEDALIENQTSESFKRVCIPKINTTLYTDRLSRKLIKNLDYFVCFSSMVTGAGSAGQSNYGFANSVMESICERRRNDGLHGVAIEYGPVGDTGSFIELVKSNETVFQGSLPQRLPSFFATLDMCINSNYAVCGSVVLAPKISHSTDHKRSFLKSIRHILGLNDSAIVEDNMSLSNLGMDSMMAVEVKQAFEREYNIVVSTQEVRLVTIKQVKDISKSNSSQNVEKRNKIEKE